MKQPKRTRAGDALTGLILDLFRLNNLLLTAGDRLVAGLGLTSARWQILGAIVAAERSQPVAWLARDLGAQVVLEPREGPAGWRGVVAAPAAGELAFWQPK